MLSSILRYHSDSCSTVAKDVAKKAPSFGRKALPGVGRIVMTASVKGGVGKSTVAINTACALAKTGAKVGLFDADIYGPSVPTMSKTVDSPLMSDEHGNFLPVETHGIHMVSLGHAVDPNTAMMWKGPLVGKMIGDLLNQALWPELDYLILDTPPGTGDVQMAIASTIPVDGAIVVTSPQQVAVADVIRNVDMFKSMKIPMLGIVQNFDGFVCGKCKTLTKIFPGNGAEMMSQKFNLDILGSLPIDPSIAQAGDSGVPAVISSPDSIHTKVFMDIAAQIIKRVPKTTPKYPVRRPNETNK